jgi:hypothetical protein
LKEKPGWQKILGIMEGKRIVFRLGTPSDPVVIFLYSPRGQTVLVQRLEKGRYRRGWLYKVK